MVFFLFTYKLSYGRALEHSIKVSDGCETIYHLSPGFFATNSPRYHFIRDLVERKVVALEYIPTERQNVDIFTKPLDRSKFESLRQVIGVITCL